jgi:hypothetical protein
MSLARERIDGTERVRRESVTIQIIGGTKVTAIEQRFGHRQRLLMGSFHRTSYGTRVRQMPHNLIASAAVTGLVWVQAQNGGANNYLPKPDYVLVVILENHSFDQIVDPGRAPFIYSSERMASCSSTLLRSRIQANRIILRCSVAQAKACVITMITALMHQTSPLRSILQTKALLLCRDGFAAGT